MHFTAVALMDKEPPTADNETNSSGNGSVKAKAVE
jgi:hypothetical protein